MEVVFMDVYIPKIVSGLLASVGGKLRKEYVESSNTHCHATVM